MKKVALCICLALLFVACNSKDGSKSSRKNEDQAQTDLLDIYNRADSLYHQQIINDELFRQFIDDAVAFAEEYPQNDLSAEMLSKAGVACMIVAKKAQTAEFPDNKTAEQYAHRGIEIFDNLQNTYPDYEGVRYCYLNRAFIYDDILQKKLDAEYEYRDFMHKFPDDSMCDNLRVYLRYINEDEETIYARIQTKEKEQKKCK